MNPELRRNFWLELTLHRLLGMPAVLLLVMGFFVARDPAQWGSAVFTTAVFAFVGIVHFMGTRNAAESVTEEVRDRTWDWQRLSSVGPWQMSWGKLAGAPAFAWYGGLICIAAIAVAALFGGMRERAGWVVLLLLGTAVMMHGGAFAASLQASRKDSRVGYRVSLLLLFPIMLVSLRGFVQTDGPGPATIRWYGETYEAIRFGALSAAAFAAWAVLAAYREMCRELKVRTLPWAFPAFAVFVAAFGGGLLPGTAGTAEAVIFVGLVASGVLTYYALFADLTTAMSLRRLVLNARAGQWRRVADEVPLWMTALATGLAFTLAAAILLERRVGDPGAITRWIALYPIAGFLLVARDCGLLVMFALARRPRRVEATTLLYIVLLSWVIPAVLGATGLGIAAAFMPFGALGGVQAALVMAAHAAIAWGIVAWRWRRLHLGDERAQPESAAPQV